MKKLLFPLFILLCAGCARQEAALPEFVPGQVWLDTDGNPINAHGGGMLYHDGLYYWYGEYKVGETTLDPSLGWEAYRTEVIGVSCYSSADLYNWKFEGLALTAVEDDPNHDLHPTQVVERPKVIYNERTGKFVMWMHVDSPDYFKACAGVAISDNPTGPFEYLYSLRPNGEMSRDQTLFVDDDGRAYHFYSAEDNATMYISLLTDDYLLPSGTYTRNFPDQYREAPAVFKYDGRYYMLSSGCSGWDPNVAELAVADSILGPWETLPGNPCVGPDADKTFYAQSTFVLKVEGLDNAYIAMFDRWNKLDLENSLYVWLPVDIQGGKLSIPWADRWNLSYFR
ncbi:MAG: glycoside hydrolase family 43 protein [Alistipes sp.]|nr:glycoside hydrolase family 43 protein [Alistipes sp.]